MRDFRATRTERLKSDVRFILHYGMGDILAGIGTAIILLAAPIIFALGR